MITIYEVDATGERDWAKALYSFKWTPQTDPFGKVHKIIDYPGVPVDHSKVKEKLGDPEERAHPGPRALRLRWASRPRRRSSSTRSRPATPAATSTTGASARAPRCTTRSPCRAALLSVGDPHAAQGDSELCGTAIECSLTGTFQLILHKKASLKGTVLAGLDYPLLETATEFVVHGFSYPNYLAELGPKAQSEIYAKSSTDLALRDAFRKMRRFLMTTQRLTEDEAISLMSIAVDFGITQVVDGNWGVHALVRKNLFSAG